MNDGFYILEIFLVNREKLNFTFPVRSCVTKSNYVPSELCICENSVLSNLNLDLLGKSGACIGFFIAARQITTL